MKTKIISLILVASAMLLCASSCANGNAGTTTTRPLDKVLEMIKFNEYKEEIIPVERVEITNEDLDTSTSFGKYKVLYPNEDGKAEYQVNYKVYPENATKDNVYYAIQCQPADCAEIDKTTGKVTFTKFGSARVYVLADDGSTAQDSVYLIFKNKN